MSFRSDWREGAVFSRLIRGGNRSPERSRGECRRGQNSPADTSQKRPAREPRNRRKDIAILPLGLYTVQIEIQKPRF
jgi:hypothetical protein